MTTQVVRFLGWDASTTTAMRAFGAQISTAMQATGLTKLTNTGQIDWTTMTPAATIGYELYRFNDSLQGAAPVYLRFQWGMNLNGATPAWPYIKQVTVGRAVDSTTNFVGTNLAMGYNGGVTTVNKQSSIVYWRFCYNAAMGFFGMGSWEYPAPTTTGGQTRAFYTIARACDDTGNPTASGLWCQSFGGGFTTAGSHWTYSHESDSVTSYPNGAVPGINTSSVLGAGLTVPFFHQTASYPTVRQIPQVLYYGNADLNRSSTVNVRVFGRIHTYLTLGIMAAGTAGNAYSPGAYAMLWE